MILITELDATENENDVDELSVPSISVPFTPLESV
jgi:hypothetical protein